MCTLGLVSVGHAQMSAGMGGGMAGIPGTSFGGATDPSMVQITEGFRIIPSIMVGQRYDSNVFLVPKTPGLNREDFVTTTIPQVRGLYAGSLVTVNATASAVGEYYAKNSGLSYVGTSASAGLDVSKLASLWREGTRLTIMDTYSYTPQPPAFMTGDLTGEGTNPFVRGFQATRVNTQTNILVSNLSVPISQTVNLIGTYINGFIKYGSSEGQQVASLIDTSYQTYVAGLSMRMSPQDTVSLNFINSEYDSGSQGFLSARGGTVGWSRTFTPNVSLISAAGGKLLEGDLQGVPLASTVAPIGNLSLLWLDRETSMLLSYSLDLMPSLQFQGQPLQTHLATFTLIQQIAIPELLGVVSFNYGHGSEFGGSSTPASAISYTTYSGIGGVTYKFTPKTFLGLTYSYLNNDQSLGGQSFLIDRQVVQLSLTQAFY